MKKLATKLLITCSILLLFAVFIISWKKVIHQKLSTQYYNPTASFRDLNKNGKLDQYEDPKQPIEARITDLLKKMTIEEKAGLMFINGARVNDDGSIEDKPGKGMFAFAHNGLYLMHTNKMNHFNL